MQKVFGFRDIIGNLRLGIVDREIFRMQTPVEIALFIVLKHLFHTPKKSCALLREILWKVKSSELFQPSLIQCGSGFHSTGGNFLTSCSRVFPHVVDFVF